MRFETTIDSTGIFPVIILKDSIEKTSAEIYSLGALLNAFTSSKNNITINIVDGFSSANDAKLNITNGFKSAKLSPFTCRMNKGEYVLNDVKYKIEKFYLGDSAIHGIIYDNVYEILNTHTDDNGASVGLKLIYTGTDKGYPFPFEILVNWKLEKENKLTVKTTVFHHNANAIPYADGWHPYFSLGNSVDDCSLQFDSEEMLEFNDALIPTGKILEDKRFISAKSLNGIFLDNCFALKSNNAKCILQNSEWQLTIEPDTHYPYLQIYTPPHRNSIAIENLSGVPDCFNNKMGLQLLEPNKMYSFVTSYSLKKI